MQTFFGLFSPIFVKRLQLFCALKVKRMNNVRLNTAFIENLSDILSMPVTKIMEKSGIVISTWYNIQQHVESISVQQLLAIANGLHIPVKRFFDDADDPVKMVGRREDYVVANYQECYYDGATLNKLVNIHASWQQVASSIGMSPQRLRDSLLSVSRTPLSRFLEVCDLLQIDPFEILVDPNSDRKKTTSPRSQKSVVQLEMDMNRVKEEVRGLHETIDNLKEKYDDLLEAHKCLLCRFNEHIENSMAKKAAESDEYGR